MKRREFLKVAGAASAAGLAKGALAATGKGIAIVLDPGVAILKAPSVWWAAEQLRSAIATRGVLSRIVDSPSQIPGHAFCVIFTYGQEKLPPGHPHADDTNFAPDGFRIIAAGDRFVPGLLVGASNERGFIYALLELAERVRYGREPIAALHFAEPLKEATANEVRCVSRYFCSELEDKPWFYDKDFWPGYLDVLAASRFNRFCLAFGLEYDFPRGVTSDYLHFPYPYLVDVPGYEVQVQQLRAPDGKLLTAPVVVSADERKKNLEALQYIAAQTAARGLHFQLGIWTHAYQWTDSPHAYHSIEGLTPQTHAAYCRDALAMLLKLCPEIQGLTLRVHGESGIPEGSYGFWETLFAAIKGCGRTIEIDMHAKGVDEKMIDIAVATGMPVKLGAKYSAEHQSLGYQQADIRALEIPKPGHAGEGPFSLSSGARSFTRYGYADFLKAGRKYKLLFRLWPGTQRHLLSADPEMAAAYGRTAHFCGAAGLDLMEPLTFKGREGSGLPGGRCAYADATLNPKYDWQKFELYYRVWGRRLYDPDADPEAWRRWMRTQFGAATMQLETAVAQASRMLPLVTSAHLPSASNHSFWPEINTNMPIVMGSEPSPYGDTPEPRCFGTVSPLDPQTFSTIEEHAGDLLTGSANPKYSPIDVAQWLEDAAAAASDALNAARQASAAHRSPAFLRMEADVLIQAGLGRFFAAKMRAGVLYAVFQQTQERRAGQEALDYYRTARAAWVAAAYAGAVYRGDISYGSTPMRRGHWTDRLAAVDKDILALEAQVSAAARNAEPTPDARRAIVQAMGRPAHPTVEWTHMPQAAFERGVALALAITVPQQVLEPILTSVFLRYRHVNQAERWQREEMQANGTVFGAEIPAEYTQSPYALEYCFELHAKDGSAWLAPGFNAALSSQPYYAVARKDA
ncbi:MAG: hypothetical protein P4K93_07680 [Terracidiphilus sp.]|nr:hypothetical protein [Terracidiphilus sp.]MDR3798016.1 hypothetical protein [Terracidiphilus sp.]